MDSFGFPFSERCEFPTSGDSAVRVIPSRTGHSLAHAEWIITGSLEYDLKIPNIISWPRRVDGCDSAQINFYH